MSQNHQINQVELINNRSAQHSYNGYCYQRLMCVYFILEKEDYEYVIEEGYEDIDFIKNNNHREIMQIKYHNQNGISESLLKSSGLYKVIIANYERNDVDKIIYYAYMTLSRLKSGVSLYI